MRIRGVLSRRSVRFAACCGLIAGAVALIGATTPRKAEDKAPPRDEVITLKVDLAGSTIVLKSVAEDGLKLIEGLGKRISSSEIPQWDPDRHSFLNVPPGAADQFPMIILDPDPGITYGMPRLIPDAGKSYTMPQFGAPHQGPVPPPDPGRDANPAPPPRILVTKPEPESPSSDQEEHQQPERAPSENPESGNE